MERSRLIAAYEGSLAADALAMPVHWYYDRKALANEYGVVDHFMAPKSPHTGSFMARSSFKPLNERANVLHDQARYWGKAEVHYHQFLKAGENTLNFKLARELYSFILKRQGYDADEWLLHYVECMLKPGWHHDSYVEGFHRAFFQNYASGKPLRECGVDDVDIGGLADVPALIAALSQVRPALSCEQMQDIVKAHVAFTHKHDKVVDAAATLTRLLYAIAEGQSLRAAIRVQANDWLPADKADEWLGEEDLYVIGQRFKPSCPIQDSMPSALYLAYKYSRDLKAGITANAMAGGENCHRGAVVGSLLGAACDELPSQFRMLER